MAEDQDRNPERSTAVSNSNLDESKTNKSEGKRKKDVEKKRSKNVHVCEVKLLDGTELIIEVEKNAHGSVLFSRVVENLDILDKEYFGLRFTHSSELSKCWLVLHKPIQKQLKIGELKFQFAVKFYEPEPGKHLDEYTRYLLYLQLREDIVYGRLGCPARTYMLLASFTAQAEFGDYDWNVHSTNYLDGYQLGPEEVENDPKFLSKVIELHKEHRGQTPAEAELNFLEVAKRTPRYGVDIHIAKNKKEEVEVGVSHRGVILYQEGEPIDSYGWKAIDLVAYKRRKFMLKLFRSEKKKNPRFKLKRRREAKNLYKSAIEHHSFFRLTNADRSRRVADSFVIGSKFRYSDRTLYQLRSDPSIHDRQRDLSFTRKSSIRQKSRRDRVRHPEGKVEVSSDKPEEKVPNIEDSEVKITDEDYEEIEIEKPYDDRYEWVIIEKTLPDGTKKQYRRRIISTTATTLTETTYVIRKGTEEEGHMMEEKPIESPRRESPEISEKEEVRIDELDGNRQKEVITTTVITKETISEPEVKEDDGLRVEGDFEKPMSVAELKASSKKPSATVKPLMREDIESEAKPTVSETVTTTTTTTTKKVLVFDVDKGETVKVVSKEKREEELREREKQREIEEEQRRQEEIRARNEREAANRRKWKQEEEERKRIAELERKQREEEEERLTREKAMSPELQEISLSTGNEEFDKEFGIKGMDTFLIKTSPMPSSFMKDLEDELNHSLVDEERDDEDAGVEEEVTAEEKKADDTLDIPVAADTRKAKTLDRKFVRRPPPERSSGYIRRSYGNELDFDYSYGSRTMPRKPRKYVPLITKEELMRAYSSGGLHDESIIRSKKEPEEEKSKIEYSLKDESGVEQGQQGFVKNLIGRHETIKRKEDEEVEEQRRSRVYSSSDDVKLFVPTRTASFGNVEKPETKKTKVPPPVKTKPVVFAADKSGLSAVTVVTRPSSAIELSSSPVVSEARQPSNPDESKKFSIPEVTTSTVVFDSTAPAEKKATSGLIDKDSVEPLWGKVVLKQRRSFRASDSFDVTSSFELLTMKEQGLIPNNHCTKARQLFVTNFAKPEIVLDQQTRLKEKEAIVTQEYEAIENVDIKSLVLNDLTPEKTHKSIFLTYEASEWSPSDYIDNSETCGTNRVPVDECDIGTLNSDVFCELDFDKLDKVEGISNGTASENVCPTSNMVLNGIGSKISNENSSTNGISHSSMPNMPLSLILEPRGKSGEQLKCESLDDFRSDLLGEDQYINGWDAKSNKTVVGVIDFKNGTKCNDDGKDNENGLFLENIEGETKVHGANCGVLDDSIQTGDENHFEFSGGHHEIKAERETVSLMKDNEFVDEDSSKNETDSPSNDEIDNAEERNIRVNGLECENDVVKVGIDICRDREGIAIEQDRLHEKVFSAEEAAKQIDKFNKENIVERGTLKENQNEMATCVKDEEFRNFESGNVLSYETPQAHMICDIERTEGQNGRDGTAENQYAKEDGCEMQRHERKRFDSCPNLRVYNDSDDDVFSNGRRFTRAATVKEPKSRISFSKLKKQSQKRKPASEGSQLAVSKSFSINSELGRLKLEYDASLAAFRKCRSKSLDDIIVTTQTISVSPIDQPESSDATHSFSQVVSPPPPDVINHSDSFHSAPPDVTDDTFPTPPPDVVTQTMVVSSNGQAGGATTTTTIVTEEVVRSHQNPPEVETRTVVISGDGLSKEEFERMISNESVTTSETTVSKTIKTEVTTITSDQTIVITGEGEINTELQQALANAAVGNGE